MPQRSDVTLTVAGDPSRVAEFDKARRVLGRAGLGSKVLNWRLQRASVSLWGSSTDTELGSDASGHRSTCGMVVSVRRTSQRCRDGWYGVTDPAEHPLRPT
jgi:hypothetical protein